MALCTNRKRRIANLLILAILAFATTVAITAPVRAQNAPVKIVGIGAASCEQFLADISNNASAERNYLAWMQGYMSGIMIGRPAGQDEGIDLTPTTFPLTAQAEIMRKFCSNEPKSNFADGVEKLYLTLKRLSGT